ncbi:MAG: GNAT family N-acetyltransferase, partial [Kangiellaceae bacterium]|nr:GNAT family N-acetyltransferase [Kangiellaceae bacterium]
KDYASATNPFQISPAGIAALEQAFATVDAAEGFKRLKYQLKIFNKTVPTLFKQYTELCVPGGVFFSAFNVDPLFSDCVDGLVVVDMDKLLEKKRKKYLPE